MPQIGTAPAQYVPSPTANRPSTPPQTQTASAAITDQEYIDEFDNADVRSMVGAADLIVVGHVEPTSSSNYKDIVRQLNDPLHQTTHFSLTDCRDALAYSVTVDRVLKGEVPANSVKVQDLRWASEIVIDDLHGVPTFRPVKAPLLRGTPQLTYGLFCLTRNELGSFDFVDQDHPVLPASPIKPTNAPSDPFFAVVNELTQVLSTPVAILTEKGGALSGSSGGGGRGDWSMSSGEVLYQDAVAVINDLPHSIVAPQLKTIALNSPSSLARLWAVNCLVSLGDWTLFDSVRPILLNPTPDENYVSRLMVQNVHDEMYSAKGAAILPSIPMKSIQLLLLSRDVEVQRAAQSILEHKK